MAALQGIYLHRLRKRYGEWFSDVSSTRKNNYAAPRIRIGSPKENPTVLSRQDRRESETGDKIGHWNLGVTREGAYAIELLALEGPETGTFHVRFGDVSGKGAVSAKNSLELELPKGPGRLETWIETADGKRTGIDFVTIRPAGG